MCILLVIIIAILCVIIGWLLGSNFADTESNIVDNSKPNVEVNNSVADEDNTITGENNDVQNLNNYNIDLIKNIEINVPTKNSSDPEFKTVTLTDKEEIKHILLNVDAAKEIGKVAEGIGFGFSVNIKINYEGDPSTVIVFLSNGNLAINFAEGVGETGYAEYEINNKNFQTELINKYQN